MPICKICQKEVIELVKRTTKCRECNAEYQKSYREKNITKEKRHEYYKKHYSKESNRKKHLERTKKWREENGLEYFREKNKKWTSNNKEHINEYWKNRYQNNPEIKLHNRIRVRINNALNYYNKTKKQSTLEFLGCKIEEYFVYLEQQFDENMNWDNYGSYWEIDHIIPLNKGGSFHYKNTQPLTITENRKKSDK